MPYLRQLFKQMKTIPEKNLKNKTVKLLREVAPKPLERLPMRPFEVAWNDIENSLRITMPHFKSMKEAMIWTRRIQSS